MIKLLNSALMPCPGIYKLEALTEEQFAKTLINDGEVDSYVGYEQTAKFVEKLTAKYGERVECPISRRQTVLEPSDAFLIIRLKYRIANPADKGKPVTADFEYFRCRFESIHK